MPFGMVVKMVRKKLAISQEQLARELRVSFSTVNRWENGRVKPSPMAIKAFKTFCEQKNIMLEGGMKDDQLG
ncbi:MAG: helix-turn-helix transcriptional regulator [Streptococcus gordonii]|nr:helix-turn-helix transcriptional regulator [Streptococcus gordonii]